MNNATDLHDQITRLERYAGIDPGNPALRLHLGDLYHQSGQHEKALDCYEACETLQPGSAPVRSRIASVMITLHRFDEAQAMLLALLASQPLDPALHHNLGVACYYQKEWLAAAEHFSRSAALGHVSARNLAYQARSFHHADKLSSAIAACRRWVELAPGAESQGYLCQLLVDDGNSEEAHATALAVLAEDPDNAHAHVAIGVCALERHEPALALEHFESALRSDSTHGRALLGAGLSHLYDSRYRDAVSMLATAGQIYPDSVAVLVPLGWAMLLAGDAPGAGETLDHAVTVDPFDAEAHCGLAAARSVLGDTASAARHLELVQGMAPGTPAADIARAFVQAAHGQRHDVKATLERLLGRLDAEQTAPLSQHLRMFIAARGRAGGAGGSAHTLH